LKGAAMNDDIISLLKVHDYFRGISAEAMQEVLQDARITHHGTGDIVHEADVLVTSIGFVLRGRLKAVRVDARGTESLFRMIERGQQFGMMIGAVSEPVPIRVVALEPTTVLRLDYERALELTFRHQEVRRLVSVTAKMEKQFCNITPEQPAKRGKMPSILETLLRSLLVQSYSVNAHGVQPADVVIEPDVSGYDLAQFTRAKELAAIGEAATLEQIPKIRKLLARLDPQLFGPAGDTPNVVRPSTTPVSR
jgi:signal-transduction protein with cAMP-binding, CBS, and nucleotidyltransferase domain